MLDTVDLTNGTSHHHLQKGYLPPEVKAGNSNVVSINKFPLGDIENFSVARAAMAKAQAAMKGQHVWHDIAPWEKQYLDALAEVEFKAMGDQVSGVDGGYLAPEQWSDQFFGLLRKHSALDQLPITRMSVPARVVHLPRVTGDITMVYPGENATITASQYKFGEVQFNAHKAAALITISNELIRDAGDLADQVLRTEGADAIATDRDLQLLTGTGGPSPTGLLNMASIPVYYSASVSAINTTPAAASPSYKNVGELIQIVENLNGTANVTAGQTKCDGAIAHSQFKQTVLSSANFSDSQGRPMWFEDLNAGEGMFGMQWALTNVISITQTVAGNSACSSIIAGHWSKYVLMECMTLGFDAAIEPQFLSDQTQVRLIHRYDGAPANAEAFAILAGVLV